MQSVHTPREWHATERNNQGKHHPQLSGKRSQIFFEKCYHWLNVVHGKAKLEECCFYLLSPSQKIGPRCHGCCTKSRSLLSEEDGLRFLVCPRWLYPSGTAGGGLAVPKAQWSLVCASSAPSTLPETHCGALTSGIAPLFW